MIPFSAVRYPTSGLYIDCSLDGPNMPVVALSFCTPCLLLLAEHGLANGVVAIWAFIAAPALAYWTERVWGCVPANDLIELASTERANFALRMGSAPDGDLIEYAYTFLSAHVRSLCKTRRDLQHHVKRSKALAARKVEEALYRRY